MPCNVCPNLFHYFAKLARKLFCTHSPAKDSSKEAIIEDENLEGKDKPSVANVAAYGDVRTHLPPAILPDILGSEVDDFDSWNEEAEILQMESEAVSLTKGEHSNYTTAELDEAIFEDNPNKEESLGMSRQSGKDVDSMVEFLNSSDFTDREEKYLDSTPEASKEEVGSDADLPETDKDLRGILQVTQTLAGLSLQASTASDPPAEALQESCDARISMMMISEPSSVTTATATNCGSSEFEASTDRSLAKFQSVRAQEAEGKNVPDDSLDSFVRTLTLVTNDEAHGEEVGSQREEEQWEKDERFTESQCTQTEELSSSSSRKQPKGQAKKRMRTKRKFRNLTHRFAIETCELTAGRRGLTVKNSQSAAGKARARSPAVGVSLFTFLQTGCCRALRGHMSLVPMPTSKRKRQRRPLPLDTAMGDLLKKRQWPSNSLINTTLCGSFRLVGQPKIGMRQDYKQPSAIAIPFVFGIQSTNIVSTKAAGDSERTVPSEANANISENSKSSNSIQSSSTTVSDGKPTDSK